MTRQFRRTVVIARTNGGFDWDIHRKPALSDVSMHRFLLKTITTLQSRDCKNTSNSLIRSIHNKMTRVLKFTPKV